MKLYNILHRFKERIVNAFLTKEQQANRYYALGHYENNTCWCIFCRIIQPS